MVGLIAAYLAAFTAANLAIWNYGPSAVPWVSFFLIGFIITTRDMLHEHWADDRLSLFVGMGTLILGGGVISYIFNQDALPIAVASVVAFAVSEAVDAVVYHGLLVKQVPFLGRVNVSNVFNAVLDSVIFVTLAFGFSLTIVALQVAAKIAGGFVWSLLYAHFRTRREPARV